jgi:hypothetical protein
MASRLSISEYVKQRPESHPMIYAYSDNNPELKGLLKVGYTEKDVEKRLSEIYPIKMPDSVVPYKIVLRESAMRSDGTSFTDHDVHKILSRKRILRVGGEWFKCSVDDVKSAILAIKLGNENIENRTKSYGMRPEQIEAVEKTKTYFIDMKSQYPNRAPKFLWNAKMRFGKTFTAYQLAKKMKFTKILVLTFKPAVEDSWDDDLKTHIDFEGWQFISRGGMSFEYADPNHPIVCFGSFQDYLGTNENGGIKAKNEWVHTTNWDLVIFDEYHFGAWRENAKKLFEQEDEEVSFDIDLERYKVEEADNAYNETFLPITTSYYLFLSGTPFRAINSGEFIEEQIYSWTYSDEQKAKNNWDKAEENPYAALPRMIMLTYRIPDSIRHIAMQGEFNEFDLNVFFSAKGTGKDANFVYENEVQKWLDLIRGSYLPASMDDMRIGQDMRPPMPFHDTTFLRELSHTFWFLPSVSSCYAMKNLLKKRQNTFYNDYEIIVAAGTGAGIGIDALGPVRKAMGDPLTNKSITLSCGKLTTGVTVKPWTGIFMLRNLKSPETYFQAAFRVQSSWEVITGTGLNEILKYECYVFDFALDRALRQISDYSCRLDINEDNPEKKVADFIHFLPVLAYDGSSMKQVNAQDILDIAMSGTSATLLAKRWESALLVNVDNETLSRLMDNPEAMEALMNIEGFRSLNREIEMIINKSDAVKKAKKEKEGQLTPKEKKELTAEEKEYKSMRKQIQEKLIKFATRIPIFMYLTDYRERSLKDVITQLEPGLFKRVTGLNVKEFELLVSLNVFNGPLMNDAIFKFKRYEDSSLSYTGIDKHAGEDIGGWDTVIKRSEYEALFYNQQAAMEAGKVAEDDIPDINYLDSLEEDYDDTEEVGNIKKRKKDKNSEVTKYEIHTYPPKPDFMDASLSKLNPITKENKETEPSVKFDLRGLGEGSEVVHRSFGAGKVISIDDKYIAVAFGIAEKRFTFPGAFENGFITFNE